MADWTDPPWAQLVAGKPWTDEKAAAAFENAIAIAEGADGAPRNVPGSLDIYLGAVTSSGDTAVGFSDLERIDVIKFETANTTNEAGQFRVSADNGATWGGWITAKDVGSLSAQEGATRFSFAVVTIALQSGWWRSRGVKSAVTSGGAPQSDGFAINGSFTPGGTVNAIQFRRFADTLAVFGLGAGA